ncbi:MAG: hypothetical protein ACI4QR_05345 [Eubacteriales bacterium]
MKIKNFFKENGYISVKILVVHIALSIFGLMVYLPFDTTGKNQTHTFLALICSIFSIVFYFFMVYNQIWEKGAKDSLRTVNGKKAAYPMKGFLIGLVAAIPDFIICAGYVSLWFFRSYENVVNIYNIFALITSLWEGMFMGVKAVVFPDSPYMFIAVPFITSFFAGISYIFGTKNIRLLPAEDNPEEEERRREAKLNKKKLKEKKKENDEEDI